MQARLIILLRSWAIFIFVRSWAIFFALVLLPLEGSVSDPIIRAVREAALSRRFSLVDADAIGFTVGLCAFMLNYFLVAEILDRIRQAHSTK